MTHWAIILSLGIVTYAIRLSFLILPPRVALPRKIRDALGLVPPAVLAALIAPELLRPGGAWDLSAHNGRLIAGGVAVLIAWRTKSALATVGTGMAALWVLQALLK